MTARRAMQAVVTGAAGHVGANLVRALLDAGGWQVRVTVRRDTRGLEGLAVERVPADLLEPRSLEAAFEGAEVVFHLAAAISLTRGTADQLRQVNAVGTRNVAAACLGRGVRRLIHFSSYHALSSADGVMMDEGSPLAGEGAPPYDRSKADAEREVLAAGEQGLDAVIVSPTAVIGPHDYKPSALGQVLIDLFRRRLAALVEGGCDWVDVRDVVAGTLAAERLGRRGERYLLGGHFATMRELAGIAQEVSGVPRPRFVAPMWLARAGAPFAETLSRSLGRRPLFTSTSLQTLRAMTRVRVDKAAQELGYRPRSLHETLAAAHRWYSEARML